MLSIRAVNNLIATSFKTVQQNKIAAKAKELLNLRSQNILIDHTPSIPATKMVPEINRKYTEVTSKSFFTSALTYTFIDYTTSS